MWTFLTVNTHPPLVLLSISCVGLQAAVTVILDYYKQITPFYTNIIRQNA